MAALSRIFQVNPCKKRDFDSIELIDAVQATFDCYDLENPMGERRKDALSLNFDRKSVVKFLFLRLLWLKKLRDKVGNPDF